MHSSCFKALHDRGSLRLKQTQSREFKATSLTLTCSHPPQLIRWVRGMLSLASRQKQTHDQWTDSPETNGPHHAFVAPSPARDWHGDLFPPHGRLAQSLTMRPTRTPSPLWKFSLQWRIFWAFSRLVFKYSVRCWPEVLSFLRGGPPRAKVSSSGPNLALFLPTRHHSMT